VSRPRSADVCGVGRGVLEPGIVNWDFGAHRAFCGRIEALVERRLWGENGEEGKRA